MTGTPTDASPECGHPASELLDFHVNGSLEGDEAAMVAAHVTECATCARDARELMTLSASIEEHGAVPGSAWRGRLVWGGIGTAAALLAVGLVVRQFAPSAPVEPRIATATPEAAAPGESAGAATAGVEVTLDLGVGMMRDGAPAPSLPPLSPEVSGVRLTLQPPVEHLRIGVRGPGDEEIIPDGPLPPRDERNRVTIAIPAARLAASGTYRVVLKPAVPDTGAGSYFYPFEVPATAGGR